MTVVVSSGPCPTLCVDLRGATGPPFYFCLYAWTSSIIFCISGSTTGFPLHFSLSLSYFAITIFFHSSFICRLHHLLCWHLRVYLYSIASFAAMPFFLSCDGTAFPSPAGEGEGARGLLTHSIFLDIYYAR
ncbi:hypothetical protein [robinz microvirus RP_152]|nr:hypothetical protein [robinz microvirus RP_152]